MPRNSSGVYTLPAGNPVSPNTLIQSSWANTTLSDVANELTNSLDRNGRGSMLAPFKNIDGTQALPGITWGNEPSTGFWRKSTSVMGIAIAANELATLSAAGISLTTGVHSGPLGAVGAPSYTFNSDSNTGMWSPAADTVAMSVNGIEFTRWNTTGFGVGVAPAARFHVKGASGEVGRIDTTTNAGGYLSFYRNNSGTVNGWIGAADVLVTGGSVADFAVRADTNLYLSMGGNKTATLTLAGDMGLGGTPNAYGAGNTAFTINNTALSILDFNIAGVRSATLNANSSVPQLTFGTAVNWPIVFFQNNVDAGRITKAGELLLGAVSSPYSTAGRSHLLLNGSSSALLGMTVNSVDKGYLFHNGTTMQLINNAAGALEFGVAGVSLRITSTGVIQDAAAIELGYKGLPAASVSTGAFTAADRGKCVYATGGVTIPNSTMAGGDVVIIQSTSGSNITITKSITTAYNCNTGTALGATFTLLPHGRCAILFESSTLCDVSGNII